MRSGLLPKFDPPGTDRSRNMSAIRSRNNKSTERRLRSFLVQAGVRGWNLNGPQDLGSPDFWFPHSRVAVFVHGCFWHSCPKCGHIPKTNAPYWKAKLERNMRRDRQVRRMVRRLHCSLVRLWECELKTSPTACITRINKAISMAREH
jgi:DNA mismatch endonuclease, patch repair protein